MTRHHPSDLRAALLQHRRLNRLQTGLLVLTLVGIATAAGSLLFGEGGFWLALFAVAGALLLEPAAASALTLRLYRARALHPHEAPEIWAMLRELSVRAGLPATPAGAALRAQRHRQCQCLCQRLQAPCFHCPHGWSARLGKSRAVLVAHAYGVQRIVSRA